MKRAAFTLVELLVVMVIILLLASLLVGFAPRLAQTQKTAQGITLLQKHLAVARSRALRDRVPTGVRMFQTGGLIDTLQFIQQPDALAGKAQEVWIVPPPPPPPPAPPSIPDPPHVAMMLVSGDVARVLSPDFNCRLLETVDFTGGFSDQALYPVQMGDYIEFNGGGLVRRITSIDGPTKLGLQHHEPADQDKWVINYRIMRSARVLPGEPAIPLPKDVVIDVNTNTAHANRLPFDSTGHWVDVLFAPSGGLLNAPGTDDFIAFWVRDNSLDFRADQVGTWGESGVVVVYKSNGAIAAHPVNRDVTNPYRFVKDGKSSGL